MAAKKEENKPQTLQEVLANALKKYDLRVGTLDSVAEDVQCVSTGNTALDYIMGSGVPLGRMVELYGPPSCGKTTTALQAAACLQQIIRAGGDPSRGIGPDDVILYVDHEQAMDKSYAEHLGLDVNHESFLFTQPDSLEQGANVARQLIATDRVRMAIWDSVAAMTPEASLTAETGKASVALQARGMSDFLKVLSGLLKDHNCSAIFLNHIMELIDMGGGGRPGIKRYSTPGGRSLKFYASVRVEYQQISNVKGTVLDVITNEDISQVVATNVRVRVVKNKVASPFKQCIVRVRYGRGFDNFWTALQILIAHKKLVYSSGYTYFERSPELVHEDMPRQKSGNKRPYIQGEEELFDFADSHPSWRDKMIAAAEGVVLYRPEALEEIVSVAVQEDVEQDVEPSALELESLVTKKSSRPSLVGGVNIVDPLAD